jgi:ribosomal protein S18 acetylase RimI-like enzyme
MDPVSLRIDAEQLGRFVQGWNDARVRLRPVRADETLAAAELMLELSRERRPPIEGALAHSEAHCALSLRSGDLLVFLELDGAPVGYLRGELYPAAAGRREFYISNIGIKPWLRSAGLGTRLMQHLADWVATLGGDAITLDFMADNPRVASFYRRIGCENAGYDLLQKLDPASNAARAERQQRGVREYTPADEARVVRYLMDRRGLRTFEQPWWAEHEIAERLALLDSVPEERVFIVERGGALSGLCWALSKKSRRGAPITVTIGFESADVESAALLLDGLDGFAAASASTESYVTLWQPCMGELELALGRGFAIGRFKERMPLASVRSSTTERALTGG